MRQFACNLEHVRDHQQQALRGRKRRRERAGLQRTVHGAGRAGLGLHLDDLGHLAPDVAPALVRPLVGEFAHGGRGRDGIDGDDFADAMGDRRRRFVAVDRGRARHADASGRWASPCRLVAQRRRNPTPVGRLDASGCARRAPARQSPDLMWKSSLFNTGDGFSAGVEIIRRPWRRQVR
jgi:hypothetical protein